jgi:hypothetical protein
LDLQAILTALRATGAGIAEVAGHLMAKHGLAMGPEGAVAALTASGMPKLDAQGWAIAAALDGAIPNGQAWVQSVMVALDYNPSEPALEFWDFFRYDTNAEGLMFRENLTVVWQDDDVVVWECSVEHQDEAGDHYPEAVGGPWATLGQAVAWMDANRLARGMNASSA